MINPWNPDILALPSNADDNGRRGEQLVIAACKLCRYWHCGGDREKHAVGQCRIKPPVVVVMTQLAQYPETHFPITVAEEWCGAGTTEESAK